MTTMVNNFTDTLRGFLARPSRPKGHDPLVIAAIKQTAEPLADLTDAELKTRVSQLKDSIQEVQSTDSNEILISGFSLVYEGARRSLGICYYDVQLMAGLVQAQNAIAQMATGEGKTFVGVLPAFYHGLQGRGVHFMTTNAYLAERDYEIVKPIFDAVGMKLGVLRDGDSPAEKEAAYACDVTYGPGYEFGFDYLRDQIAVQRQPKHQLGERYRRARNGQQLEPVLTIQREHAFAIIDELDSVLIDEATTPLILSGAPQSEHPHPEIYHTALATASSLNEDDDYISDPATNKLRLTKAGVARAYQAMNHLSGMPLRRPWPEYVEQALHSQQRLRPDVDYVVANDEVQIVDQQTGRIFPDRTWRNGLHQLIEAKEGLVVSDENDPIARMSRQQYFQLYDGLCGMTGTATGSEREFAHFYKLPVIVIPTRKENCRVELPMRFFGDAASKWRAIAAEVARLKQTGQPVLVGTNTIEASQLVAEELDQLEVPYALLNGKQDEEEADIVSAAGQIGAVTIATNMAGRGTDIKLGPGVEELGGLHVIVTEPNNSQRVDRQLLGRSARQGNPGSFQTFVSADDSLVQLQAPWLGQHLRSNANKDGEVMLDLSREVGKVQCAIEKSGFAKRRQLFARDTWLEDVMAKLAKQG